jgi:hypothetical protein
MKRRYSLPVIIMPTTTHLVCAPDDLTTPAVVTEWLANAGSLVTADMPLVRLAVAGEAQTVLTPLDGVLMEHCVAVGEPLAASDLLAMIEAEEPEFGISFIEDDDLQANLAVPACRLGERSVVVEYDSEALALCAMLGVAPDEVPCEFAGSPNRAEVERHVRNELRLLATLRQLLATTER